MIESKQTVCFIVGTLFSGSTILGNALNGSTEVTFLGEIDRLRSFKQYEDSPDYYVDQSIISNLNNTDCPFWSQEFVQKISTLPISNAFLEAIKRTNTSIVVDGSKNVNWLTLLYPEIIQKCHVIAIISARNPFAFSSSYIGIKRNRKQAWFAAQVWRDTYRHTIRCLFARGIPTLVVRYEDFMLQPQQLLQRKIVDFLGIQFQSRMMHYWEAPNYALGGNVGAYLKFKDFKAQELGGDSWKPSYYEDKPFGGWISERWIQSLNESQIDQVATLDGVMSTAFDLGYNLGELIRYHQQKCANINSGSRD